MELSDEELMEQFVNGRHSAFQLLTTRHGPKIYNFVLRKIRDRAVAEELVQEVFLRVVKNASSFRRESRFTTWLYTIARNQCIDHMRRAKHRRTTSLDKPLRAGDGSGTLLDLVADKAPGSDTKTQDRRFVKALESALETLPDEQREVFMMREMQGLKFREIAGIVGISENTVKSRMRYALETLRGHLAPFVTTPSA